MGSPPLAPRVSTLHQLMFDVAMNLSAGNRSWAGRMFPRTASRVGSRLSRRLAASPRRVKATMWGRKLYLGSDHRLPYILMDCPRFGEPLGLLVDAIPKPVVRLIDVGANIGDTIALVEQHAPGKGRFLCVEPDPEFADLCRLNTAFVPGTMVVQAILADGAPRTLRLVHHTPGTAAPEDSADGEMRSISLDSAAGDFVRQHGGVDVIKVDTDGFDASVLRSAGALLDAHFPMVFFELHPYLWSVAGEDPIAAFRHLKAHGYRQFLVFTNRGDFHSQVLDPDDAFVSRLVAASLARRTVDDFHYDVMTGDPAICAAVVDASR